MSENYSCQEALEQGAKLFNIDVSIQATLIIQGSDAYLVESVENPDDSQRILIHCPDLELQLDLKIGGWMGSAYSYIDPVFITGKLQAGTTRKNKLVLSEIKKLTLWRDEESINLNFDGRHIKR
jgi:hypothetical protein